jgi:hypothetical protein
MIPEGAELVRTDPDLLDLVAGDEAAEQPRADSERASS